MRLPPMKFQGEVVFEGTKKRLKLKNPIYFAHHIKKFTGPVTVTIEEQKTVRSMKQNRRYWGAVINTGVAELAEYTGHTADELHEFLKRKFLKPKLIKIGDETVEYYTTTTLTKGEFVEYSMNVEQFMAQFGIKIPTVDQYYQGI